MAQIVDQRDLLAAYRPGDLQSSERIVRVYQNEVLRSAFLMTASAEGSVLLARDAFLRFFRHLVRGDVSDDPRYDLFNHLGHNFLAEPSEDDEENGDRPPDELAGTVSFDEGGQRYHVEDQRSRALASLELLEPGTRVALILRDFNGLDEEQVCRILDEEPFSLRQRLHPARDRLKDASNAGPDQGVRDLLVTAATAAPRPDLWPEVVGPLEEIYAREDERRQHYTYAAAGFVGLLLIIAGLWLFDVFPFGSGDGNQAIAPTAGPSATPTPTPEPTMTPTPIPELSSFAIPQGDVPGRVVIGLGGIQGIQRVSETGFFDLETGTYTAHQDLNQFGTPSPDGRFLLGLISPQQSPDVNRRALVAVDNETGEQVWKAELPEGSYTFAATLDRVYLTTLIAMDNTEAPILYEYDLETGELLDEHPNIVASILNDITSTIRVLLRVSPDGKRLFIALEEFGSGPTTMLSRTLASFELPDLIFESASIQTDSTSVRQFPTDFSFSDARVTPDGTFLYAVNNDMVQFRSSDLAEDLDRPLWFTRELSPGVRSDLRWITSNDGRYLYVVALDRNQAAVVDLLGRRVVRSFPLETAEGVEPVREVEPTALGGGLGAGLALSSDGRYLYIAGGLGDEATSGEIEQSIIWTVDLTTWTVVRSQELSGLMLSVNFLSDQLVVSMENEPDSVEFSTRIVAIEPDTGEVIHEYGGERFPDWVDNAFAFTLPKIYQIIYARSAAIDHVGLDDVETESTLPRVTVQASSETPPAGSVVEFAVRVLNPGDGQLQAEPAADVRFDPGSTVVMRLTHEEGGADEIILIASPTEPALYQASTTIRETGFWNAHATITGPGDQSWTTTADKLFEIIPSWEASNGKRYVLRVRTDPTEPPRNEVVTVAARFVEVETGEPLPDSAEILDEFPEQIRVIFAAAGSDERSATLTRDEQGIYQGEIAFRDVDAWEATVAIVFEDGETVRVKAGVTNVVR